MSQVQAVTTLGGPAGAAREVANARVAPAPGRSALPPAVVFSIGDRQVPPPEAPQPGNALAAATWGSPAQVVAVASGGNLDAAASRAVFDRGHWPALRAMAADRTTRLPADVAEGLVAAARLDTRLGAALVGRADLPPGRAATLATNHSAALAGSAAGESSGVDPKTLRPGSKPEGYLERGAKADESVDVLAKLRPLRPADIAYAMSLGRVDEAMAVVARMANVPSPAVIRAYEQGDIGFAIQQMRALGLDQATSDWLLRSLNRVPANPARLAAAGEAYGRAAQAAPPAPRPAAPDEDVPEEAPGLDMSI